MIRINEYLLSKSNKKIQCEDYIPEIGEVATDQFGDSWVIKDYCSILNDANKLKTLIEKYDETHFFESWVNDAFNKNDWFKKYKVDDVYAVAVALTNGRTPGQMKKAVYVWGPDDLWYRDDTK